MNILINKNCNLECPYCFARDYRRRRIGEDIEMSLSNFERILNFLKRSGHRVCRIQGGEPTLHKQFPDLLNLARDKGFKIKLFTNGLFNEDIRDAILKHSDILSITMNVNHPSSYKSCDWQRLRLNMSSVPKNSALGVNIYQPNQDCSYVLQILSEYPFAALRIGITHSTGIDESTIYCIKEKMADYFRIANQLAEEALAVKQRVWLECGITPCQIDRYLGEDITQNNQFIVENCRDCPAIDAGLNVFNCFQSENPNEMRHLSSFSNLNEIYSFLSLVRAKYRNVTLYDDCGDGCVYYRNGLCLGGCLADKKLQVVKAIERTTNTDELLKLWSIAGEIEKIKDTNAPNADYYLLKNQIYIHPSPRLFKEIAGLSLPIPMKIELLADLSEILADISDVERIDLRFLDEILDEAAKQWDGGHLIKFQYYYSKIFARDDSKKALDLCMKGLENKSICPTLKRKLWRHLFALMFSGGQSSDDMNWSLVEERIDAAIKDFLYDEEFFLCRIVCTHAFRGKTEANAFLNKNYHRYFNTPYRDRNYHCIYLPLLRILSTFKLQDWRDYMDAKILQEYFLP